MKSIKEITDLKGKRVLVRFDFNVPIQNGKVVDDFRIKKAIPTIEYLHKKGAIIVILSHLGESGHDSLAPVATRLKKYIPTLKFVTTSIFSDITEDTVKAAKKGDIFMLENVRKESGEKNNSPSFARALSRYGEIFVNDAFSVSHRPHASIIGITKYLPGYAGLQLMDEVKHLSEAFNPKHPFLFILGGAKFSTKMPLVKKFLRNADNVFISGALANDFFKAKGYEVGKSLVEEGNFHIASLLKHKNLLLPKDVRVVNGKKSRFVKADYVDKDEAIVDSGPETIAVMADLIKKSKFVLWNGPLGKYENGFGGATEELLKLISKTDCYSVIGGGDTVAIISKLKLENKLGFVSTGGGATLDFLAKGTLPGIKVLK
mgnify:CR=1 FL=1